MTGDAMTFPPCNHQHIIFGFHEGWDREAGPLMERTIRSVTGRQWKMIGIG
jgi:hypothetical protein